ncbi:hypothetical protein BT69DRAFT_1342320 [Atractiella rhizophila]|nr:hypothetical protein BT69DRAFT_1342320 [Atractiella rhizophila]
MAQEAVASSSYDLTSQLLPNLDRHLALPLLDFLASQNIRTNDEVLEAKFQLLKPTNMVTYLRDLRKEIRAGRGIENSSEEAQIDQDLAKKEESVVKTLADLQQKAVKVMEVISGPEVVAALRQDKMQNLAYLKDNHGLNIDQINDLYQFGHYQYTIGHYSGSSDYLYHFCVLSPDNALVTSALWGKLVSDILEGSWTAALDGLDRLRENIESRFGSVSAATGGSGGGTIGLKERTWWLHWSLFVYWNAENGRSALVDSWLSQSYLNAIQTASPHLLRYLVVALVISRSSSPSSRHTSRSADHALREIVRGVVQEKYQYSDPITEFVFQLYQEVNFEQARQELDKCEDVMRQDFFLDEFSEEFLEGARALVSEVYCKIHRKIDIADLSDRLGLSKAEGERWIVNLVREARLDAKIDFKENAVHMNHSTPSPYQKVIELTKGIQLNNSFHYVLHPHLMTKTA